MWLITFVVVFVILYYKSDSSMILRFYDFIFPNLNSYKNKVVWITGASSGIGKAIALELAARGARLAISGTNKEKLSNVQQQCLVKSDGKMSKDDVMIVPFDVSDEQARTENYDKIKEKFGKIDVFVNNAGMTLSKPVVEASFDQLQGLMNVNFLANIHLSQLVARDWVRDGTKGRLIVNSSICSFIHSPFLSAYSASKAGLNAFYNSMRSELYHKGISITTVCPGVVRTEIVNRTLKEGQELKLYYKQLKDSWLMMTPERCARLMLVAGANRCQEVVVAKQPQLIVVDLFRKFGKFFHFLVSVWFTKSRFDLLNIEFTTD